MASPAISSPAVLLVLLLFFPSSPIHHFFSFVGGENPATETEKVSREFFPMEGDVAWIVQVSDLHLSSYHPERAEDIMRLLAPALRAIQPALVFVTGDITVKAMANLLGYHSSHYAKNRRRTSSSQDESEWVQYKNAVDALVKKSGIEKRRIFDIRGNHDKYGVPCIGSQLDFFSNYSVSRQFHRLGTIQSVFLVGRNRKYMFLGIDDTMSVGIRGPSNLFGHPTSKRIGAVQDQLQYWDHGSLVTKVVFGHFPMSFTASSEKEERYEALFAKHSVSAYICGHLHSTFGKQLWRFHEVELPSDVKDLKRMKRFWEWEVGDWKDFRFIRILSIDQGAISFLDVELSTKFDQQDPFQTTILITYPMDSRFNNVDRAHNQLLRNDINALVFSLRPIVNVTVKVFDSLRNFKIVEEIPLQHALNHSDKAPLFHAKWNAENYRTVSAMRYWLQVQALDNAGKLTSSFRRPFSVEGRAAHYSPPFLAYLIFYLQWENIYSILLWGNISFLILLLFLPILLNKLMERNASYQKSVISIAPKNLTFSAIWFLIDGSRNKKLWGAMVVYLLYLLILPWFWGYATSKNGQISAAYLSGWKLKDASSGFDNVERLGIPDMMTVTLPFMYFVVTPLFIVLYSFSAERSAACFHLRNRECYSDLQVALRSDQNGPLLESYKITDISSRCKIDRWRRKALFFASAVIACIHLKEFSVDEIINSGSVVIEMQIASGIMAAYGFRPVVLSLAISWAPLLFLVVAIYSTMEKA
ncbi:Putative metallophosphoesterase [Apostasia shenzhenica]|uniref:Metallophosphoesterase n=1 Tax=Apostasia shenzhenica TaxID=1088818 RepID=A0A2I0AA16_9ASPA|nr:Putative metallophosphoesterase [Apostasia shenzhenica]